MPGSSCIEPGFVFTSSFLCRLLTLDKFRIHFNKITRSVFGRYNHEYARFGIQTAEYFWCHIMDEEALWWGYNLALFRYAICYWCRRLPVLWQVICFDKLLLYIRLPIMKNLSCIVTDTCVSVCLIIIVTSWNGLVYTLSMIRVHIKLLALHGCFCCHFC